MHTDCIPSLAVSSSAPLASSPSSHCWSTSRAGKARTMQSPSFLPSTALGPNEQGKFIWTKTPIGSERNHLPSRWSVNPALHSFWQQTSQYPHTFKHHEVQVQLISKYFTCTIKQGTGLSPILQLDPEAWWT